MLYEAEMDNEVVTPLNLKYPKNMEEILELLRTKVEAERNAFRRKMSNVEPLMVYENWYKICFFESYYELLMSDEMTKRVGVAQWLVTIESPLDYLYHLWLVCDAHFSGAWDDMIDWLAETYEEMVLVLEEDDLLERDAETNRIKVSKDILDDFEENKVINVQFVEGPDSTIKTYVMVEEDDDGITMEYIGEVKES